MSDAIAIFAAPGKKNLKGEERKGARRSRRRTRAAMLLQDTLPEKVRGMDITWLTDRVAVGGGIWTSENMAKVAGAGITHIIDMQIEFDDTPLGIEHGVKVLWNPTDDDFEPKPPELFVRGVEFAAAALEEEHTNVLIHCAAGVHRAPMMALAVLGSQGWPLEAARDLIVSRRPVADLAEVYFRSVEEFMTGR